MNQHRVLALGSALRVTGLVATTVVAFFLMPFLVHRLGDRLYGYWSLIGAVLGYYGILELGIVSAVQFHVAKALGEGKADSANRAISTSFFTFSVIGSIVILVTLALASVVHLLVHNSSDVRQFREVLLIAGFGLGVGFPGRVLIGAICAHLRWDLLSWLGLSLLAVRTALVVWAIERGGGIVALAVIAVACDAVSYTVQFFILRKIQPDLRISFSLASVRQLKEILGYGGWAMVIRVADQLRFYFDGWVVAVFVGVGAVTHYAIGSRISLSFMSLLLAITGVLAPWFSHMLGSGDREGMRRVFGFSSRIAASISTIVASCLLLYGRSFISQWMGVNYVDAFWPLAILVLAVFCAVSQQPSTEFLWGVSKHGFLAKLSLTEGIINFGLSIYLARDYGMVGVALGTMIPMVVTKLLVQPLYICRQLDYPLRSYYSDLLVRPVALSALAVAVPWVALFRHVHCSNVISVCAIMASQGVIGAVMVFLFVLSRSERSQVFSKLLSPGRSHPVRAVPVAAETVNADPV